MVDLRTAHLNNLGTIAGRKIALLNTDTFRNEGTIQGDKVGIKTTRNFDNIGGKVEAERGLFIDVGGDFTHQSTTHRTEVDLSHFKNSHLTADKVIIHSEAGGLTLDAAYSKAKVDYAQVNEQAGISVGEGGMNVKVHQHTQLNGGVIESEAEASKNRLQTHSISSTDIENHSEIKTESASISAGSGGINPMQALSSALSLLGNRHESSRSHTKSAISQNIAIQTKTPENLTALSRDTKNANEQVQKQDLQKVQEQQEMAKVIGEIVDNGISIATFEKREALNKLSLEKFQAEEKYGLLSGWLSGLSSEERSRFLTLVENENNHTISALNEQQTLFEKGLELGLDTARFLRREEGLTPSNQHSFAKKAKNPNINNKDWKYIPAPKKEEITGFKDLTRVNPKTPIRGGGTLRDRWKDKEGNIYEWDSQHGAIEKYNKRGKHLGEFDFKTGKQIKSADPTRRIEP